MLVGDGVWKAMSCALAVPCVPAPAQERTDRLGAAMVFQDPAVPMIALPTRFTSQRVNSDEAVAEGGSVALADLRGPGCVRHIWILYGAGVRLEITVDGAETPQVHAPLKSFFGVMHDLPDYFVDCAAYTVLPNPAPGMPGDPGYNLYLPIPFSESCRIVLHAPEGRPAVAMVDWHQYDDSTPLTHYRLHTEHHLYAPSPARGGFVKMAGVEGEGFVAGVVAGYIQRDHTDMVFHTGGMTFLLDGETVPHAIRGHNVEDDFGFTWGFNDRQSRWIGCPYHVNRGRTDQDGVFYRFFGPDPIAFRSSLVLRTGSRGDDIETVVYYYRVPDTNAPPIRTPPQWQVTGPFPGADDWDAFERHEFVEDLPPGPWPDALAHRGREWTVVSLASDHAWIDLGNVFFERNHTATPLTLLGHSAYARATIESDATREAVLRLAVDDWCLVWLNGGRVTGLRHEQGLETARIPIKLRAGANELLMKTSNSNGPPNKRLWVINCIIE